MVQGHTNCDHDGGRLLDTTSSKPTEGLQWLRTVNFNECHNAGSHTLLCMLLHSSHLVKITLTPAQLLMLGVKKRKSSNLFNIIYTIKADRYVTDIFGRRQAAWVNMSFLDTGLHVYV